MAGYEEPYLSRPHWFHCTLTHKLILKQNSAWSQALHLSHLQQKTCQSFIFMQNIMLLSSGSNSRVYFSHKHSQCEFKMLTVWIQSCLYILPKSPDHHSWHSNCQVLFKSMSIKHSFGKFQSLLGLRRQLSLGFYLHK